MIRDIGKYQLRAHAGGYSVLIGESNVAIDPAIWGYGVADIYLGEFSPHQVEGVPILSRLSESFPIGIPVSH